MVGFGVLGPFEVRRDGVEAQPASAKQRLLAAVVLVHANEVVAVDRLVAALWGDRPPATATGVLRTYVSQLRKVLEPDPPDGRPTVLVTADPGYRLVVGPEDVDAWRFERRLLEGRAALARGRAAEAAALLQEGLALWRGPAFADLADEEPIREEARRLDELRIVAIEERVEADLALGDHATLAGELAQLVAAHPLRERLWAQRITCLYRAGRQADALGAYQELRHQLADELGLAPSPQLAKLEREVLEQAPSLDWVAPRTAEPRGARSGPVPASHLPVEQDPLPFVGRASALDELRAWWSDPTSPCRLALVSGEAGVGKTRLVTTFARLVEGEGATVLYGRAVEAGGSSYEPVLGALRQLVLSSPRNVLDHLSGTAAAALSRLVPELAERRPELAVRSAAMGDVDRSWLLGAVAGCFPITGQPPTLLVLDDLQWADRPALLLLANLIEPDRAVHVLATHRSPDGGSSPELGDFLADLRRDARSVRRLPLGGLEHDDVVELVGSLSGGAASAEAQAFATHLHRRTDGNGFFLREAIRQLEGSGTISIAEGRWAGAPALDVLSTGEGVREVVANRLARLRPGTRATLQAAAVLGSELDVDLLAAVLDVPAPEVIDGMDEAQAAGLVQEEAGRVDRYGFVHALVSEVVRGQLGGSRAARLEWRAGEVIEALRPAALDVLAGEVARHLSAGAAAGDPGKAMTWSLRAAEHAMARLAYEEAVRAYGMALEDLDRCAGANDGTRADVLIQQGRAANLAGDAERWSRSCMAAAAAARRAGDDERVARAAISLLGTLGPGKVDEAVVELLEEAAAGLRDAGGDQRRGALLAEVLARLSGYLNNTDHERSATLADEALTVARSAGDERSLALALVCSTQAGGMEREAHQERLREATALAHHLGDQEVVLSASSQRMAGALLWADRDEFDDGLGEYVRVARATGWAVPLVLSDVDRAAGLALDGRNADALALFEDALRRSRAFRDPNRHGIRGAMLPVHRELGQLAAQEGHLRRAAASGSTYFEVFLIRALCDAGQHEEAAQRLEAVLSAGAPSPGPFARIHLGMLAEAVEALGHRSGAGELSGRLQAERAHGDCATLGAHNYFGALRRHLGVLAAVLARWDDAVAHHEAALAVHDRLRAPGWAARSRYDLAKALVGRGRTGDTAWAGRLLDDALAATETLQVPALTAELRALRLAT